MYRFTLDVRCISPWLFHLLQLRRDSRSQKFGVPVRALGFQPLPPRDPQGPGESRLENKSEVLGMAEHQHFAVTGDHAVFLEGGISGGMMGLLGGLRGGQALDDVAQQLLHVDQVFPVELKERGMSDQGTFMQSHCEGIARIQARGHNSPAGLSTQLSSATPRIEARATARQNHILHNRNK